MRQVLLVLLLLAFKLAAAAVVFDADAVSVLELETDGVFGALPMASAATLEGLDCIATSS